MNPLNRRSFLKSAAFAATGAVAGRAWARKPQRDTAKMNIVLLGVEDWSARAVGCYGNPIVKTPNVDKLAAKGVRFSRAYCAAPACNPSRTALTTGTRPDTNGVYQNEEPMVERTPLDTPFIAGMLGQNGAWTATVGKLVHLHFEAVPFMNQFDQIERPQGQDYEGNKVEYDALTKWIQPIYTRPNRQRDWIWSPDPEIEAKLHRLKKERDDLIASGVEATWEVRRPFQQVQADIVGDSGNYPEYGEDGQMASIASQMLEDFVEEDKQFFLHVGFHAPHTPLRAPREFVDMYNPDEIPLPPAPREQDKNIPQCARHGKYSPDIFNDYNKFEQTPERVRKALQGYYACASYVDWAIGIVMDKLDALGLADNTIVMMYSDHGFHLGEHGCWSKYTLFEQSTNVPFICYVPGAKGNGKTADGIVEYVDIVPTLCDLWNIPPSKKFEGISFAPLLKNPKKTWKKAAFSQINDGRAVRTERYRYAEYRHRDVNETPEAFDTEPYAREFYDLKVDPWEQNNVVDDPTYADLVAEHAQLLRDGWKAALPKGM